MIQAILSGVKRRDDVIAKFAKAAKAELVKDWDCESLPIIMGNLNGCAEIQMARRSAGLPYIYIDHGYFSRGYDRGVFRVCVSHYHCTDWRSSDRKRWSKLKDWHKGDHIIVIPPSEMVKKIYNKNNWVEQTVEKIKRHTDRRIIVKPKGEMSLPDLCEKAHALVSFGSVADVEAAMMGVPIFCSPYSPSIPIALRDLSQIETPTYPDREQWLRSLSAAEWHVSEFDQAWERVESLLTPVSGMI